MKFNARTTLVILAVMTLLGALYMSIGVLDISPTKKVTRLTLLLNTSGGLLPTSDVTMRGIKIGRVTGIRTTATGLAVSMDIDQVNQVPADSAIAVENLSAAGEQYVDFKPKIIAPPYLSDGSVIPPDRVAPMVTGSELLTKANALISALNPDDLRTIVTNVSQALDGNDGTLDSLATTAGLAAKVVRDDKQILTTLFSNISTLTTNLGTLNAGQVISETGTLLPKSVPAFLRLVKEFENLSYSGSGLLGPDDPGGVLIAKISEYMDTLAEPLSTFATVLQPAVAPLHDVKLDAGHWLDFWESTFNDNGSLRVQLNVPEWHQGQ
ncbi:MlaD family protein [Mycobacterium sp. DL592]|uniref:MlaD family protein n=1 Tax=Mycobacterium sp. DL592 TaxID=2675524 RepID=UPI00141F9132|nr:MlaD family protein [Mycobacterium sp. DL592]